MKYEVLVNSPTEGFSWFGRNNVLSRMDIPSGIPGVRSMGPCVS